MSTEKKLVLSTFMTSSDSHLGRPVETVEEDDREYSSSDEDEERPEAIPMPILPQPSAPAAPPGKPKPFFDRAGRAAK